MIVLENRSPALQAIILSIFFLVLFHAFMYGANFVLAMLPPPWSKTSYSLAAVFFTLLFPWLFGRVTKVSLKEMGLILERATMARFIRGLLIGLVIFALMMVALLTVGSLQLQYKPALFSGWSALLICRYLRWPLWKK